MSISTCSKGLMTFSHEIYGFTFFYWDSRTLQDFYSCIRLLDLTLYDLLLLNLGSNNKKLTLEVAFMFVEVGLDNNSATYKVLH